MKNKVRRNHWYEGITEAIQMYIPGNKVYRTIQARRARTGTLFILPLIIGFLLFMVRPLYLSFLMSLSKVVVVEGTMSRFNISLNILGKNLLGQSDHPEPPVDESVIRESNAQMLALADLINRPEAGRTIEEMEADT